MMNKKYLNMLLAGAFTLGLASCSDNAWNDNFLDGFEGEVDYEDPIEGSYTLSTEDYETISKGLLTIATNYADTTAARAIASNLYFDNTSSFPASKAVAYFLSTKNSPYYYASNGSTVDVTYQEASSTPEELNALAAASTYTVTSANYKTSWGSETDYIDAFAPSTPASNYLPNILKAQYPEATAGSYAVVTYNTASENPIFGTIGGDEPGEVTLTDAIKNLSSGDNLRATAVVTGQCTRGLILTDNGGSILYYNTAVDLSTYPIGTIVNVSGQVSAYNRGLQLSNTANIEIVGSETYNYPTPIEYTPAMVDEACDGSGDMLATFVSIKGELSVSGSYYNVIIDGASAQGSIYYVTDEIKDQMESGNSYTYYGYYIAVNGSSTKYFNILVTAVGPEDGSGAPGTVQITDAIKNLSVGSSLEATAVVTGQCTRGLILTDKGGSILYYNTGVDLTTYPIGTVVNVSGDVSAYNRGLQLSNTASIEAVSATSYTYPTPEAYTPAMVDEACDGSGDMLATYVSITGELSVSGSYYNVIIDGASAQGSIYYVTDELKSKMESGNTYTFTGYFIAVNGSSTKYFNILVTDVTAATATASLNSIASRTVAFAPSATTENAVYYFNGSTWSVASGVEVLNPADYTAMGFSNNSLSNPEIYIPLFLKSKLPYAMADDEIYVVYNGNRAGLFIYDGATWTLNNNGLETVTGRYVRNSTNWSTNDWAFQKYIGKAVYNLFTADQIELNRGYLLVSGSICATPINKSSSYGYIPAMSVTISGDQIVMASDENTYMFMNTYTYNDAQGSTPEGTFLIRDTYGRYLYLQGTYNSFNLRSDAPYIESDGSVGTGYLFTATRNDDNTWVIHNVGMDKNIYYSGGYNNFAGYATQSATDYFPVLYQLDAE